MKILKINYNNHNAYVGIKTSMKKKTQIPICNDLDACGCTGNGQC